MPVVSPGNDKFYDLASGRELSAREASNALVEERNIAYFADLLAYFRTTRGPFKQPTEQDWQAMIVKDNQHFFSLTQIRRYSAAALQNERSK